MCLFLEVWGPRIKKGSKNGFDLMLLLHLSPLPSLKNDIKKKQNKEIIIIQDKEIIIIIGVLSRKVEQQQNGGSPTTR